MSTQSTDISEGREEVDEGGGEWLVGQERVNGCIDREPRGT